MTMTNGNSTRVSRIAVDIGGTFTDIIVTAGDRLYRAKVLSSPPSFGTAVIDGLAALQADHGLQLAEASAVVHGTTVATNAILERRGGRTGLVTTTGFRDVLELGRMRRPTLYDPLWEKPTPLVPRRLRVEVNHRITAQGDVESAASPAEIAAIAAHLRRQQVESVAVCLLNSYGNPTEERRIADQLAGLLDETYVSASADVLPEIKEYERMSTTVVNAYVRPAVDRYIGELEDGLERLGVRGRLLIMQSAGGLLESDRAREAPVRLIESGPAAGVIAARALTARLGMSDAITFDMGGTTAKAALIESGMPFEAAEYEVGAHMNASQRLMSGGGYTVRMPSIEIAEVGSGGGSIVWIDDGGAPRVGPQSAGAAPGPACYGAGGVEPTFTDALVVLGYLNRQALAGGSQRIDVDLAERAIRTRLADPLGLDLLEAAYGVYRIAIATMSRALKAVTSERGRDPRDFALIGFGGAGPACAAEMALQFGINTTIVPMNPGLFSAVGLMVADIQYHDVISNTARDELDATAITEGFEELERRTTMLLQDHGYSTEHIVLERFADIRYAGQSSELRIRVPPNRLESAHVDEIRRSFDEQHERTYGHSGPDQRVELVNLRLRATYTGDVDARGTAFPPYEPHEHVNTTGARSPASRSAYFGREHGVVETPVVTRAWLDIPVTGPIIVEDMDATTVIPPGLECRRDRLGNLIITTA